MSPENEAKLDVSLARLGVFKPVLVRELPGPVYEILGGEHRRDSAIRQGLATIAAYSLGVISDDKAKEIGLADNARYGVDDVLSLAELLGSLDDPDALQLFLPYSDLDIKAIFASSNIALDELDDDAAEEKPEINDELPPKPPKTHAIMRFKVPLGDSERISALLREIQKTQGFTLADDLTNAGDALVHHFLGTAA